MVLGIPLAKFIPEVFKAISKPFVNVLKRNVPKSPFWKDKVFIPMAQYYNKQSLRMRLWTQGIRRNKEQVEKSSRMSDEAALELGAEIVANTSTFLIGLVAILMQQSISSATERKKAQAEEDKIEKMDRGQLELHRKILDIGLKVEEQDAKIRELTRTVASISGYGMAQTKKFTDSNDNKSNSTKT